MVTKKRTASREPSCEPRDRSQPRSPNPAAASCAQLGHNEAAEAGTGRWPARAPSNGTVPVAPANAQTNASSEAPAATQTPGVMSAETDENMDTQAKVKSPSQVDIKLEPDTPAARAAAEAAGRNDEASQAHPQPGSLLPVAVAPTQVAAAPAGGHEAAGGPVAPVATTAASKQQTIPTPPPAHLTVGANSNARAPVALSAAALARSMPAAVVADVHRAFRDVVWEACSAVDGRKIAMDGSAAVQHVLEILRPTVASIVQQRSSMGGGKPPVAMPIPAAAAATTQPQGGPEAGLAEQPFRQVPVAGWAGAATMSEGVRAVGTSSPSPAATPPPVVQRQGPAEEGDLPMRLAMTRTAAAATRVEASGELEEAKLRDAAEVLMSLVKQPATGVTEAAQSAAEGAEAPVHLPAHARAATPSPPISPNTGAPADALRAAEAGIRGTEDTEMMGLEVDDNGRRISQRRRRPNMRIHDELEPSEREKAWGKGRGRRAKGAAAAVPAQSTPSRKRPCSDAGSPGSRSRAHGSEEGPDAAHSMDARDADRDFPADVSGAPPDGCTSLSLDLLRQLRERGGMLTGLELIVNNNGEWMKARVQKCDHDFRKVVVKYIRTNQVATLNWHVKDTASRVVVPINPGGKPGASNGPGVHAPADPSSGRGGETHVDPSPATSASMARMAQQAHSQHAALPFVMSSRMGYLNQMNAAWQAQAQAQAQALMRERQMHGLAAVPAGVPQMAQFGGRLGAIVPTQSMQGNPTQGAALNPAMLQQVMQHMAQQQENGNGMHQVAAALAAIQQHQGAPQQVTQQAGAAAGGAGGGGASAGAQQTPSSAGAATATGLPGVTAPGAAVAGGATAAASGGSGGAGGGPPVQLEATMFPHLFEHLRSGSHKVLCKVRGDGWERMGVLLRADTAMNGIVCEYREGDPRMQIIQQKELEDNKLSVDCIRVLDGQ